eukprot:1488233-Amphidinium_carterae.2
MYISRARPRRTAVVLAQTSQLNSMSAWLEEVPELWYFVDEVQWIEARTVLNSEMPCGSSSDQVQAMNEHSGTLHDSTRGLVAFASLCMSVLMHRCPSISL